ncbi:MAG: orotidine-5'-phosphate decarboxylase [Ignavibacteria bacterium]|nr:MAG: orotidine-5'-phosphate decarboxylase [Ignavibacteria bacterium]KAF0161384.1 MAG: orotidine-5'-phosphate decarboxylase [Ignavibacteria bacterium]
MTAREKLDTKFENNFHVCVGLDTDINKIPKHLLSEKDPVLQFNKIIIESTSEHAACFKINFAFYEKIGAKGFDVLAQTLELIPKDIFVIADAKRGDIGNTSEMYAVAVFDELKFDSITLHPYMGFDSLQPFLNYKDKINFILALTSNKGALDFEKQKLEDGRFLFQHVIEKANIWNEHKNCGIVFGATKIEELKENIASFDDLVVLLPGVGAQGGSLEEVATVFNHHKNNNFLINISRALLYCDESKSFHTKVIEQIKTYNQSVFNLVL